MLEAIGVAGRLEGYTQPIRAIRVSDTPSSTLSGTKSSLASPTTVRCSVWGAVD